MCLHYFSPHYTLNWNFMGYLLICGMNGSYIFFFLHWHFGFVTLDEEGLEL